MKAKEEVSKSQVLAQYLKIEADDIEGTKYDKDTFEADGCEYMVLTDDEADEKAAESIKESAWAFNKSFLDGHSESIAAFDDKTWAAVVDRCESANPAVLRLIDDVDHFISDAIASDGRGHFLNTYDGEENEVKVGSEWYYVYRMS
jgi:hypothetical protein